MIQQFHFCVCTKKIESRIAKRYFQPMLSTIHHRQEVEATQMSINRWINTLCYTHTVEYY